jgi:hypothetical protein
MLGRHGFWKCPAAGRSTQASASMNPAAFGAFVRHVESTVDTDLLSIVYESGGPPDAPVVLLLHGDLMTRPHGGKLRRTLNTRDFVG